MVSPTTPRFTDTAGSLDEVVWEGELRMLNLKNA